MSKIIMMRGLPASGKTTKAKELVKEYGNAVRISRDDLRAMLHNDEWSGAKEKVTRSVQRAMVEAVLEKGFVPIIDDTNITEKHKERWQSIARELGAKLEVIDMDTDLATCLQRNRCREKRVPDQIIWKMALQSGRWDFDYPYQFSKREIVLVDVDGTLANLEHRVHYVRRNNPDYDAFFMQVIKDAPRKDVIAQVKEYADAGYPIFIISARPETTREDTERWLSKHLTFPYVTLLMRQANDKRPDTDVKQDILNHLQGYKIKVVFDDRPSVIRMWRENGLEVIDVGDGVEF